MRVAIGSDMPTELTEALRDELISRGHEIVQFGAIGRSDDKVDWPIVSSDVAREVASGAADEGVVCCWSGTGASIAANKIHGIRAALVGDAETAKAARIYNHANVLALSLRATSVAKLKEILDAWFQTPVDTGEAASEWNRRQIERVSKLEAKKG